MGQPIRNAGADRRRVPSDVRRSQAYIRTWMREVMAERGWTAEYWARAAGTSATNITRPLAPGSSIVPNIVTIVKLARAAGSQPNLTGVPDMPHVARRGGEIVTLRQ